MKVQEFLFVMIFIETLNFQNKNMYFFAYVLIIEFLFYFLAPVAILLRFPERLLLVTDQWSLLIFVSEMLCIDNWEPNIHDNWWINHRP